MVAVLAPPYDTPPRRARLRTAATYAIAWLVLAIGGPALELADRRPDVVVRVVADPRRFRDILLAERPRIVVVAQPPAGPEDLDLVANERRRRTRLRAVHLAPAGASPTASPPCRWASTTR